MGNVRISCNEGSEQEKAIDISKLRAQTGYITLDYGFKNTGSTQSAIIPTSTGRTVTRYRGYSIEELAENASFIEVAYLLIYGDLPNAEQSSTSKKASHTTPWCTRT